MISLFESTSLSTLPTVRRWGWAAQFRRPRGIAGWLAGCVMAVQNAPMSRLAVQALAPRFDDEILEIGFGPGATIALIAPYLTRGHIFGIDPSWTMVRLARRLNRCFVHTRRVTLRVGGVSSLPFASGRFTKVFELNTFDLWPSPLANLSEVRRVLRNGGLLVLCLRMRHPTRRHLVAPGHTGDEVAQIVTLLGHAGFRSIRTERHQVGREVTCVRARR